MVIARRSGGFGPPAVEVVAALAVHASGRYLTYNGQPKLLIGEAAWSMAVQLTTAQVDSYLDDRAGKGCTAIMFSAVEHIYSSNTPRTSNANGDAPFTSMVFPYNWTLNNAYWNHVDYIVNACKSRGMVCVINPAYWGLAGDGVSAEVSDSETTNAELQAYGAALASRYTQGNIIWCMGGDNAGDSGATKTYGVSPGDRDKHWQIIVGIRSVNSGALVTGHTSRNGVAGAVNGEAWLAWNDGYPGFAVPTAVNNIYTHDNTDDAWSVAANAYGRSGPIPFFNIEAGYQNTDGASTTEYIPAIQTILSGGLVGAIGGHDVLWHFGCDEPGLDGSGLDPAAALSTYLTGSYAEMGYLHALMTSYSWHLLVPKTDTSLVTTSLGTGASRICPARASDGSFAMIWTPTVNFTVDMTALTPSSVRGRWWNPAAGTFATASGSPFANTGTQAFTAPGDRVLVLDAA